MWHSAASLKILRLPPALDFGARAEDTAAGAGPQLLRREAALPWRTITITTTITIMSTAPS